MEPSDRTPVVATRNPPLALNCPALRRGHPPARVGWWGWMSDYKVYPPAAWVIPNDDLGPIAGDLRAQLPAVEGLQLGRVRFAGIGEVVIGGTPKPKSEMWVCSVAHRPDPGVLQLIAAGQVGRPPEWAWMTPAEVLVAQVARLRSVLLGMSALVARDNPEWWGEPYPLTTYWLRSWTFADGIPIMHAGIGLDLRDRESWI